MEQGRWRYQARRSAPSDFALYASLRAKKSAWVSRPLREGRGHAADQQGVWAGLADIADAHQIRSTTAAMHDFYTRDEAEIVQARVALQPIPGQVGALAYVAGRWAGLDLLAGPRLFATAWPRLCAGYAADALRRAPAEGQVPAPAVGLGAEYRLAGKQLAGATLAVEGRVAHLMAFSVQPAH